MYKEVGRWMFNFQQDWTEWFSGNWNWRGFTLIHAHYEDYAYLGYREVDLGLVGLRANISYLYNPDAEGRKIIDERMKELDEKFGPKEG